MNPHGPSISRRSYPVSARLRRDSLVAVVGMAALAAVCAVSPAPASTIVSGNQSGTWTPAGSPYIVEGHVTVPAGLTLTIQAGVVVRFYDSVGLYVRGTLIAEGTPLNEVTFTSDNASPNPGDWQGLMALNTGSIDLNHTWIHYPGDGGWSGLRGDLAVSIHWDGGGVDYSANHGIAASVLTIELRNLLLENNGAHGLWIIPSFPPVLDQITANNNGGRAMFVAQNPGSFPGTLSGTGNGTNGLCLNGSLGGNATWTWANNPDFPYVVVDNMVLAVADTLEIAAGTVVKFQDTGAFMNVSQDAVLRTLGTGGPPENPVWLTSLKDDSRGGDTNGDGNATNPAPGDWMYLVAGNGSEVHLQETWLAYGGIGPYANLISSSGYIDSISWDGGGSLFAEGDGIDVTVHDIVLSNLLVEGNGLDGIDVYPSAPPVFDHLTVNNNGGRAMIVGQRPGSFPGTLAGTGNGTNGLCVNGGLGGSEPDATWTWASNPNFPYVVVDFVSVSVADTLEIAAGTVVKFEHTGSDMRVSQDAVLRTLGTSAPPENQVWFTSFMDDSLGGDTNGDGGATSPAPGDWQYLIADAGSELHLQETWLAYGGAGPYANLYCLSGPSRSLTWIGGGSIYSANHGAYFNVGTVDCRRISLVQNTGDGGRINAVVSAVIDSSDIHDNDGSGLVNILTSPMVDARNCWWGDASGPYDPTNGNPDYNPDGLGDEVSDWIIYRPWQGYTTGVDEAFGPGRETPELPMLRVGRVEPNPSPSEGALEFSLPATEMVKLEIWSVRGRLVRRLFEGLLPAGDHEVHWDGRVEAGNDAASGVFFYRLQAESGTVTRKAILIR